MRIRDELGVTIVSSREIFVPDDGVRDRAAQLSYHAEIVRSSISSPACIFTPRPIEEHKHRHHSPSSSSSSSSSLGLPVDTPRYSS